MAYTTFPAYAQFLLDGYGIKAGGGVSRDEMDDGYTQQQPKLSRTLVTVPLTYRLTSLEDQESFERWRRDDLANGSLFFAWPDPRPSVLQVVRRARIVKGDVEYEPLTNRMDDWTVAFTLEYYD